MTRVPDDVDRRRVWIELTREGGEKLSQEVFVGYGWLDRTVSERLTPEDRRVLEAVIPVLRKLASEASRD